MTSFNVVLFDGFESLDVFGPVVSYGKSARIRYQILLLFRGHGDQFPKCASRNDAAARCGQKRYFSYPGGDGDQERKSAT